MADTFDKIGDSAENKALNSAITIMPMALSPSYERDLNDLLSLNPFSVNSIKQKTLVAEQRTFWYHLTTKYILFK